MADDLRRLRLVAAAERHRATVTSNLLQMNELQEREQRRSGLAEAGAAKAMTRQWQAQGLAAACPTQRRTR